MSKCQCKLSSVAVISNQHLVKCGTDRDREITVMDCLVKMSVAGEESALSITNISAKYSMMDSK